MAITSKMKMAFYGKQQAIGAADASSHYSPQSRLNPDFTVDVR